MSQNHPSRRQQSRTTGNAGGALNQADELLKPSQPTRIVCFRSFRIAEEVLLAALRNPALDHQHLLTLLNAGRLDQ
jgi:hypothetical protein